MPETQDLTDLTFKHDSPVSYVTNRCVNAIFRTSGSGDNSHSCRVGLHLLDISTVLRSSFRVVLLSSLHLDWDTILPGFRVFQHRA